MLTVIRPYCTNAPITMPFDINFSCLFQLPNFNQPGYTAALALTCCSNIFNSLDRLPPSPMMLITYKRL